VRGGGVYSDSFEMNGGAISDNGSIWGGGGVYASVIDMAGGTVSGNASKMGGGIYVIASGDLSIAGGEICGNEAGRDGGGIFAPDFSKIAIGASPDVKFYGNTAQNGAFWLEDYAETGSNIYNPGVEIEVGALKALHGPAAAIKNTACSSAPEGSIRPFAYLANNYDLNFNGETLAKSPPTPGNISKDVSFGLGTIPMRPTLYGLAIPNPGPHAGSHNHVINPGASDATDLEISVISPMAAPWELSLSCSPFAANGVCTERLTPVAVDRKGGKLSCHELVASTLTVYSSSDFESDLIDGRAKYRHDAETSNPIGTWTWDKLLYEIEVMSQPGGYQVDVPYQTEFTWSIVVAP